MLKHIETNIFNWYRTVAKLPLTSLICGESRMYDGFGCKCAHFCMQTIIAFSTFNNVRTFHFCKIPSSYTLSSKRHHSVSPSEALWWHHKSVCVKFLCAPYYGLFNVVNAAAQVSNEHTLIARLTLAPSELILAILVVVKKCCCCCCCFGDMSRIGKYFARLAREMLSVLLWQILVLSRNTAICMKLDSFRAIHFTTNSTCNIVETAAQSESKAFSKYGIEFMEKKAHNDYTHAIVMQWYKEYDRCLD